MRDICRFHSDILSSHNILMHEVQKMKNIERSTVRQITTNTQGVKHSRRKFFLLEKSGTYMTSKDR
jgi:hypothetical protein